MLVKAQGANELHSDAMCFLLGKKHQTQSRSSVLTAGTLVGQGATEYLVLLAVVLIVALVSVALLGFFPGMASDAQMTQSQIYWQSASPISVVETQASQRVGYNWTEAFFKIRNIGAYTVQITKIIGGNASIAQTYCSLGTCPSGAVGHTLTFATSPYFKIAPGEERVLGYQLVFGNAPSSEIVFRTTDGSLVAKSECQNDSSRGILIVEGFGFEYNMYIEGQQITKRQIGVKPLMVKCLDPA